MRLTICFLSWRYNSICPVCEAGSLWGRALVLSVCIVFWETCSLWRAFVCQPLSAAEMFGVTPYYTTASISFWSHWTQAPKSMRKGQLICDGPHFKRPKEWEEEGWRERAVSWRWRLHMWGFASCVHTHTLQRGCWTSVAAVLFSCVSLERERDWRLQLWNY